MPILSCAHCWVLIIFNVLNFVIFISCLPYKKSFLADHNNTELLTMSPCWASFPKYKLLFLFNLTSYWRLFLWPPLFLSRRISGPSSLPLVCVPPCLALPEGCDCNISAHPPPFIDWSEVQFLLCSSFGDEPCNLKPACIDRSQGEFLALDKYISNH